MQQFPLCIVYRSALLPRGVNSLLGHDDIIAVDWSWWPPRQLATHPSINAKGNLKHPCTHRKRRKFKLPHQISELAGHTTPLPSAWAEGRHYCFQSKISISLECWTNRKPIFPDPLDVAIKMVRACQCNPTCAVGLNRSEWHVVWAGQGSQIKVFEFDCSKF